MTTASCAGRWAEEMLNGQSVTSVSSVSALGAREGTVSVNERGVCMTAHVDVFGINEFGVRGIVELGATLRRDLCRPLSTSP